MYIDLIGFAKPFDLAKCNLALSDSAQKCLNANNVCLKLWAGQNAFCVKQFQE